MISACEGANPECPYFNRPTPGPLRGQQEHGCFSDTDHIIPRFMGRQACSKLLKNFIRSKANQQQLCRNEHDIKTAEEWKNPPIVPSERFMIDAIVRARREHRNGTGPRTEHKD